MHPSTRAAGRRREPAFRQSVNSKHPIALDSTSAVATLTTERRSSIDRKRLVLVRQFFERAMKVPEQEENLEQSEGGTLHTSDNGSGLTTAVESPTLGTQGSEKRSSATGPRTELGKRRASRNATKHGVFSKAVVLTSESRAEYERLWAGLREYYQPEGTVEELLVEKLATLAWRHRRLLLAESAEIRRNTEFVESDKRKWEHDAVRRLCTMGSTLYSNGLILAIDNPVVFEFCIRDLGRLQEGIQKFGFRPEIDTAFLMRVYGSRERLSLDSDLYDSYIMFHELAEASQEDRVRNGYPSPPVCQEFFSKRIDKEVRRLKRDQKTRSPIEALRTQLKIMSHHVPDDQGLDRLLRYEASLDRSFDRTLSQLERLQRMRLGQPVVPKLEVRHSVSRG